jgi:hypothetical protein
LNAGPLLYSPISSPLAAILQMKIRRIGSNGAVHHLHADQERSPAARG